jgi:ribonuclease-3
MTSELVSKLKSYKPDVQVDSDLLVLSLTHRSFANENKGTQNNERLEFLGDSIVSFALTSHLYERLSCQEGALTKMRAILVSRQTLAKVARKLELGKYVLLGKGERETGGKDKDSILCDTLEALIGAVYLCSGIETTRSFIIKILDDEISLLADGGPSLEWKESLYNLAKEKDLSEPEYSFEEVGPQHKKKYIAHVKVNGSSFKSEGSSKKNAQYAVAEKAYSALLEHKVQKKT